MKKLAAATVAFLRAHFAPTLGTVAGKLSPADVGQSLLTAALAVLALTGFTSIDGFASYLASFVAPYFATGFSWHAALLAVAALAIDLGRRYLQHNPLLAVPTPAPASPVLTAIEPAPLATL